MQKLTLLTYLIFFLNIGSTSKLEAQTLRPMPQSDFQEILSDSEITSASSKTNGENSQLIEQNDCGSEINLGNLESPYDDSTIGAGNDFEIDCLGSADDKIFFIDIPANAIGLLGQTNNNYDSKHRISVGGSCPGGELGMTCEDDPDISSYIYRNTGNVQQRMWWIQDGYSSQEGNFTLAWLIANPSVNDVCSQAIEVTCGQTIEGSTTLSFSDNVPSCSTNLTDDSGVWYKYIGGGDMAKIDLCGSAYDSKIGIFRGNCNQLECVADGDDSGICGDNPIVAFQTVAGEEYYILVTGADGQWGDFQLQIECFPPIENDFCEQAIDISCGQTLTGSTISATPDDVPLCNTGSNGVWYKLTGNGGNITADLCGSDYDSFMSIYTGNCSNLECILASDDECGFNPEITFPSINNETYHILVTGYSIAEIGNYQLNISCEINTDNNLAISQILQPQSACNLTASETVRCTIQNLGETPQSNFDVGYRINGDLQATETVNVTLNSGDTHDYTFNQTADFSAQIEYDLKIFVELSNDQEPANNTLNTSIEHQTGLETSLIISGGSSTICTNDFIYLQATGGDSYEWQNGSTLSYFFEYPEQTTTYTVIISDQNGCSNTESVTIEVLQPPATPLISASAEFICPDGSVVLSIPPIDNILWSTGETTASVTVEQGGWYWVTITSAEGCTATSAYTILYEVPTPEIFSSNGGVICEGDSENLNVYTGFFDSTFSWSTGETTQDINVSPTQTETYSVIITTQGCTFIQDYTVSVVPDLVPQESVSNMLPPDGAVEVGFPVNFSWSPAENAAYYDLYIGLEGTTPTLVKDHITQINTIHADLQFGNTYCWKIIPKSCSGQEGPESATQCFTLEHLPDLQVANIEIPTTTAFSGTEIEIGWEVQNNGIGDTKPATRRETVHLSKDELLDPSDIYLSTYQSYNVILSGESD
ncbi:MAG: CARDB domain-containing protein, partial [Chitinophagales bacterium]